MKKILCFLSVFVPVLCNGQAYFRVEQDYPNNNGNYTADMRSLPAYSDEHIQTAFNVLANSGIYFDYPQGGCQNRAEMMHIFLQKQLHMQHVKVWIFAPTDLYPNDNRHLEIKDPNGNASGGMITWKYHVAPALLRKRAGGVDTVVIDPAIDHNKAMLLKDWLMSMRNSNVSKYTFLDNKWYFFYTNGNVISGFFYPYTPDEIEDYHRSTMERGLAVNDLAKFLMQKLKDGYNDSDGSIKNLLSKQDNMYNFFMNPYNNFDTVGTRARLLKNHPSLMREAEQYYWQRVAYWQAEANRLISLP